jgi:hypothetical protein
MKKYDFADPKVMGEAVKKVKDSNSRYYVDVDGQLLIAWNGGWITYDKAASMFPELRFDNEN